MSNETAAGGWSSVLWAEFRPVWDPPKGLKPPQTGGEMGEKPQGDGSYPPLIQETPQSTSWWKQAAELACLQVIGSQQMNKQ